MRPRGRRSDQPHQYARSGNATPLAPEMLTPAEMEELRRIGREQTDFFLKAFAEPQSRRPLKDTELKRGSRARNKPACKPQP